MNDWKKKFVPAKWITFIAFSYVIVLLWVLVRGHYAFFMGATFTFVIALLIDKLSEIGRQ